MSPIVIALALAGPLPAAPDGLEIDPNGRPNEDCYAIQEKLEQRSIPIAERVKYFRHYDPVIRRMAAFSLLREGEKALPHVLKALQSDDVHVIRAGCDALAGPFGFEGRLRRELMGSMPPEVAAKAAGHLAKLLDHKDMYVREGALLALSNCGKAAAPYLDKTARLRDDPEWWVRSAVARVLENVGQPQVDRCVPGLADSLRKEQTVFARNRMRDAAVGIARSGRSPGAIVKLLLEEATGDSEYHRDQALEGLGRIGPPAKDALPVVEKLIEQQQARLRKANTNKEKGRIEGKLRNLERVRRQIAPEQKASGS